MKRLFIYPLLLFIGFFQSIAQETVYLESTEKGRGILKNRSGECFVITPEHVVSEAISTIRVIGAKNVLSEGKLVQAMAGVDLAVVRVMDGGSQNCTNWSVPKNFSTILNQTVDAYLELRDETGGVQLMQVFINSKDEEMISIVPKSSKDSFLKGMSGGSLFTQFQGKKIYLGMLQEIGEDGEGYVYQADDMERILGGFFGSNSKNANKTSFSTTALEPSALFYEEEGFRFDFLEAKKSGTTVVCKLRVTSLDKDQSLLIYGNRPYNNDGSLLYDQNGVRVLAKSVTLGQTTANSWVGNNYVFIKGVPVPLEVKFIDVGSDATGISLLEIGTKLFKASFKNISFAGIDQPLQIPVPENVKDSQEMDGFKFDLIEAKKSGTTVVCKLRVTSLNKDQSLLIYGYRPHNNNGSLMYDQNGVQVMAKSLKLGETKASSWVGNNYTLVKGVPVPLELKFENVDSEAKGITLLKINTKSFEIQFRNIGF